MHTHMEERWQQRSVSTCPCQLQYHVQAHNTHIIPCVQSLSLHMTDAIVFFCMGTLVNVKGIVAV